MPEEFSLQMGHVSVTYCSDRPYHVVLDWPELRQELFLPGACDTVEQEDVTYKLLSSEVQSRPAGYRASWIFLSKFGSKTAYLDLADDRCEYYLEFVGSGTIDTIRFFEGMLPHARDNSRVKHLKDGLVTPYERYSMKSAAGFRRVFVPEPNVYHEQYLRPFDRMQAGVTCDLTCHGGNSIANPGLLCFVMNGRSNQWVTLGLAADSGDNTFSTYEYQGGPDGFGLRLKYWGRTSIDGKYRSPKIVLLQARSEYEALEAYVGYLRRNGLIPSMQSEPAPWWNGPIVSGWGHQCHMADLFRLRSGPTRPPDNSAYWMCTQSHYETFVSTLNGNELPWQTLVVDVRWTERAGLKTVDTGRWPDMPGFVQCLHGAGKKALLWWAPWETDGLPHEDCVQRIDPPDPTRDEVPGRRVTLYPDISVPRVRQFLQRRLRHLLTSAGCDFDGLKLDHVVELHPSHDLQYPPHSQRQAGIELLHEYQRWLYDTAKALKEDCLIIGHSPNPYFADCCDMVRIGPLYTPRPESVVEAMTLRARMARLANPDWLIDMDGWPLPSLEALVEYLPVQVRYGVPSLYYSTNLDTTGEAITASTYRAIRDVWHEYIGGLA